MTSPLPDRIERLSLLAQALVSTPDWSELARLCVLRIFDSWGCTAAAFFVPAANRSMSLDAAYGYGDDQAAKVHYLAPSSEPLLEQVLHSDELLWFSDAEELAEVTGDEPLTVPGAAGMIIMPISRLGIPERILVLSFNEPLPNNPASEPFVGAIRSLLELHGGAADWAGRTNGNHTNGDAVDERPSTASDVDLSARQLRILELLALGKTNRWIAADLGFSESTIRQETLRLYRALGVNSRTDAVVVARSIGLIASA